MSLIGVNLTLKEARSTYIQFARVILFQTPIHLDKLNLENIKTSVKSSIIQVDIWWASQPYLRVRVDNTCIDNLTKMYSLKPFSRDDKDNTPSKPFFPLGQKSSPQSSSVYMVELALATGDGYQRNIRNPDILCDVSSVVVIEDMYNVATILHQ